MLEVVEERADHLGVQRAEIKLCRRHSEPMLGKDE
jgi:hypothetical protein